MNTKAFKLMMTAAIKKLVDLLRLDPVQKISKDELIDLLLIFLGEPPEALGKASSPRKLGETPSGKKRKNSASESSSKDEENENEDDSPEEEATRAKKDESKAGRIVEDNHAPLVATNLYEMPSDDVLRQWCRAYVTVFNERKTRVNHAMAALSEKFGGMDMTSKKPMIHEFLTEEMYVVLLNNSGNKEKY
jgi:hypothetical protein